MGPPDPVHREVLIVTADTNKHAMLSPSGASRWMSCPGSVALEAPFPESHSVYSDEGTCAHGVAAMCLTEGRPATAYIGRRIEVGPHRTYEFTEAMAEPVQVYVDSIWLYAGSITGFMSPHEIMVEIRVPVGHVTGEEGAEGTADAIIITEDQEEIQVHDLKFGRGVRVEAATHTHVYDESGKPVLDGYGVPVLKAKGNPQMMLYALGALKKYDVMGSFKRVRLVIHQPRLDSVSEWDCTVDELRAFEDEARDKGKLALWIHTEHAAGRTSPPETWATLVPSTSACKFCKAKAVCPALGRTVEETVGASFEVLNQEGADIMVAQQVVFKDSDELAQKMLAVDLIETWIKGVRAEVERRLLAGDAVPDFKIVQGRQGNRAWSDKTEAEALLKSFRLRQEEMYTFNLMSPTAIEKVLKESPKRWKKAEALITRSEGGLSVAHVSDKRPAVEVKPVADAFETIAETFEDLV